MHIHNKRSVIAMIFIWTYIFYIELKGEFHCQNMLLVKHDKFIDLEMEHMMSINNGNNLENKIE